MHHGIVGSPAKRAWFEEQHRMFVVRRLNLPFQLPPSRGGQEALREVHKSVNKGCLAPALLGMV